MCCWAFSSTSCGCRVFDEEVGLMDRLLNFTTGLSVFLIVLVLASVRRAHIRVEYSVSWLVASVVILVLSRSRSLLEATAAQLGIEDPPLALLLLAGCVFVIIF